jgi:hypothetical protein
MPPMLAEGRDAMAGTPRFKIYTADGEYTAACKYVEDAAALVAILGDGATIRPDHHKPAWTEGAEEFSAGESYDRVGEVVYERMAARSNAKRLPGAA